MTSKPPFDIGDLPSRDELSLEGAMAVKRAISEMEDLGLGLSEIACQLIYSAVVYASANKDPSPREVAMKLVGVAALDVGHFCEPEEFRALGQDLERIARDVRAKMLRGGR